MSVILMISWVEEPRASMGRNVWNWRLM